MTIEAPPGAYAGQHVQITTPDGQIMGVTVPAGVGNVSQNDAAVDQTATVDDAVIGSDDVDVAVLGQFGLAENTSDGVTAPIFWFLVAGLPGLCVYKAINTLDSMIGHKSDRYRDFGFASARLDDLVNLPASRLTALVFTGAALVMPDASARAALIAVRRDARHHKSPNAGWPEAAMAGALGFKLAGPRVYHGVLVDDAHMGDGRADLTAADIRRALGLYRRAIAGALALIIAAAWLL